MITQCSMRHLYAAAKEPGVSFLIDKAKTYERRRCGHKPEEYLEPLSTKDCLASVVDPKGSKTNKHGYVIASQDLDVRKHMRGILGVPLVYINRSVMIMEPMAEASAGNREKEERVKFRAGLKRGNGNLKRKRNEGDDTKDGVQDREDIPKNKKNAIKGPKGPNPLAMKKSKKRSEPADTTGTEDTAQKPPSGGADEPDPSAKRKRRRKNKSGDGGEGDAPLKAEAVGPDAENGNRDD